ncbi:ABC transporter permease [Cellvibrio sp. NN19]|uniref:MlaE family ABC transporter permease n=1 Tax=Cellvibrio chitinivorans TaxID=3102792 RepID=UPI002B407DEB|nr:ABC transporter permease [Cellvibrio sp. NN19]
MLDSAEVHFRYEDANLHLLGDWQLGQCPDGESLINGASADCKQITLITDELNEWDSSLAIALLQLARWCEQQQITLDFAQAPEALQELLNLATSIPPYQNNEEHAHKHFFIRVYEFARTRWNNFAQTLTFIGDIAIALGQWLRGAAKTRRQDIVFFIDQSGPRALAIVTLIALLVGMILAYLGSVQLRQLGAEVYVADLVAIGMVREMGALMTAVIMAGRTGAAYAAQLGTMQVNEEIDALKTMGISTVEFLVLPRLIALVFIMPLMCIYADAIGIFGGALVAMNMDVNLLQYVLQTREAVSWIDIAAGLIKSLVFGVLIAVAGCQAGLNCGRNSDAVGMAATNAVVRSIVYLVVADAAFNILYDKLGI